MTTENCCGDCRHWYRKPLEPQQGDCRLVPPQIHLTPKPATRVLMAGGDPQQQSGTFGITILYPPLPENFVACDQFEESIYADDGTKPGEDSP